MSEEDKAVNLLAALRKEIKDTIAGNLRKFFQPEDLKLLENLQMYERRGAVQNQLGSLMERLRPFCSPEPSPENIRKINEALESGKLEIRKT